MALSSHLQLKFGKKYEPSSTVHETQGNDLTIKTDEEGNAVVLFYREGYRKRKDKGERYSLILKWEENGRMIKDHWDRKGKIS